MKKINFIMIFFIVFLSCKSLIVVPYHDFQKNENETLSEPTAEEKEGIKLKIRFPETFKKETLQESSYYTDFFYDSSNDAIMGSTKYIKRINDTWHFDNEDINKFLIKDRSSSRTFRGIYFNDEFKPLNVEGKGDFKRFEKAYSYLLNHCYYYIPDFIMKINDAWDYSILMENYPEDKSARYFAEINAKFELLGYSDFREARCAVIKSEVRAYITKRVFNVNDLIYGGTMNFDVTMNNILYLDYKNQKVLHVISKVLNKAKGNYYENWGRSIEEATANINEVYRDMINMQHSYYAVYYYDFIY